MIDSNTVEQINAEHQAVVKAGSDALQHAIEAGKLLTIMFEKVNAEKKPQRKWSDWLAENCPEISGRTDRDYRNLAKNKTAIRDRIEGDCSSAAKSIRWALGLLRPKPAGGSKKERRSKKKGSPGAVEAPPPSKGDLYPHGQVRRMARIRLRKHSDQPEEAI